MATARGPYRSDDEGQHWELINHGLQRPYTLHISAAPDATDLVLVTVSTNARRQQPQLYRSTTGGHEWQHITSMESDDDMVVAIDWDPSDPQRVYAGTDRGRIFCSHDRGVSWEPLPMRLHQVGQRAIGCLQCHGHIGTGLFRLGPHIAASHQVAMLILRREAA